MKGKLVVLALLLLLENVATGDSGILDADAEELSGKQVCSEDICTPDQKPQYAEEKITKDADKRIRQKLDKTELLVNLGRTRKCISEFDKILAKFPESQRALYGKAKCLESQLVKQPSDKLIAKTMGAYQTLVETSGVPKHLLDEANSRLKVLVG